MRWLTLLAPLVLVTCIQPPPVEPPEPPKPPDIGEEIISPEEAAWVEEMGAVRMFGFRMYWSDLRRVVLTSYDGREILSLFGPSLSAAEWIRWYRVGWTKWFVWDNDGFVREIVVEHRTSG